MVDIPFTKNAFNRTIVELKQTLAVLAIEDASAFNRTIVELKLSAMLSSVCNCPAFNRTIVELKLSDKPNLETVSELLIEPLWN